MNCSQAIHVFLDYSVSEEDIKANRLRACSQAIDYGLFLINNRVATVQKFSQTENLTELQKMRMRVNRKDSREVYGAMDIMINANILRNILLEPEVDRKHFTSSWTLRFQNNEEFVYKLLPSEWIHSYGRPLNKIIEHLYLMERKSLDIYDYIQFMKSLSNA